MSDSHGGGKGGLPLMGLAQHISHQSHESGYHITAKPLIIIFVVLNVLFLFVDPYQAVHNFALVSFIAPIWVPYMLLYFTFEQWVIYKRSEFIAGQKNVLLELRMPRDTKKTPLAMEAVFANLFLTGGEGTWYKKYIQGGVRAWFSFEIVSIGGHVRFYVWTREGLRRGLESFFYAQYPEMEIVEAEDYSLLFDPAADGNSMFGDEFIHTKPDAYPIKTYVEYGLDKAGAKPEEIIDPLAQLIELLGSVGPKEQLWIQMIIRASKDEKFAHTAKGRTWKDEGKDVVKGIRESAVKEAKTFSEGEEEGGVKFPTALSPGQTDVIKAIERNTSKQGFDVGLRSIYTAPNDAYQGTMIGFMLNMFRPFSSESLNGFRPSAKFDARFNDYPWEDKGGHHRQHLHHQIVDFYRRRAFFHAPYIGEWMVMSTEELATIYHVPSASVETPSLPRIGSATSGAPSNLPT